MGVASYKVVVTVPISHTEAVFSAMTAAGGGQFDDNYDSVAFIERGEGRFRPLAGSNPNIGTIGEIEKVIEDKISVSVTTEKLQDVVNAIHTAHPYEVPVIDVHLLIDTRPTAGVLRTGKSYPSPNANKIG